MKRKLAFGLLILVLGAIGYFGVRIYQDVAAERAVQKRVQSLPEVTLADLEGTSIQTAGLARSQPAILMFFTPSCPYCQSETRSIRAHSRLQESAGIFMISSRPTSDLRAFVDSFQLAKRPQIRVLRDSSGAALRTFGVEQVPKTFVYDRGGDLIRQFEGEVGASKLYSLVNRQPTSQERSSGS